MYIGRGSYYYVIIWIFDEGVFQVDFDDDFSKMRSFLSSLFSIITSEEIRF